jgi:hypothetical protein
MAGHAQLAIAPVGEPLGDARLKGVKATRGLSVGLDANGVRWLARAIGVAGRRKAVGGISADLEQLAVAARAKLALVARCKRTPSEHYGSKRQ